MSSPWFLFTNEDNVLLFRSRNEDSCRVISVKPADSNQVIVTLGELGVEIIEKLLEIKDFTTIQNSLTVLEQQENSERFCKTLESLMRGRGYLFHIRGTPLTSTPTVESRKKSVLPKFTPAITGFDHQVEVLRNLHPQLRSLNDDVTSLNSKDKNWRKACAAAMGLGNDQYRRFGGLFKEAITVACFSRRCYREARHIMVEMIQTRQKVNAHIFSSCCGYKYEHSLFELLQRLSQGHMSRQQFRVTVEEEKMQYREQKERDSESELRIKIARLEKENNTLKAKLSMASSNEQQEKGAQLESTSIQELPNTEEESEAPVDSVWNFSDDAEDLPPPPKRRIRQASYTVVYRPTTESSETELDDSTKDPDWTDKQKEKSTTDTDDLNEAFVASPRVIENNDTFNDYEVRADGEDEQEDDINEKIHLAEEGFKEQRPSRRTRDQVQQKKTFKEGERVLGFFQNTGQHKWCSWEPCTVVGTILNGHMYRVTFDDGVKRTLKRDQVKEL